MAKNFRGSVCCLLALVALTTAAFAQAPPRRSAQNREVRPSDLAPASLLVYNFYASSATNPAAQDTRFSMSNTNPDAAVFVHLFFVADYAAVADNWLCLAPNQTASFLASKVDPQTTGYLIAIAVDEAGVPISFNHLLGAATVKLASGHRASFNAMGFPALYHGRVPGWKANDETATLNFDGKDYPQAPQRLALSTLGSPADGNSTIVVVNSLNGSIAFGATRINQVTGVLADDAGQQYNFNGLLEAQLANTLSDSFPLTTPRFSQVLPAGHTGWLQIAPAQSGLAVTGAALNFNPRNGVSNNGFNLQHLAYTDGRLVIPVFIISCDPLPQ